MDVAQNAVLEGNAVVEGDELVVVVVDGIRVGEVDGEDADALGSCATHGQRAGLQTDMEKQVTYSSWGALMDYTGATRL